VVLAPLGVIGALIHWPVYRLIGFLATHLASNEDEMVATIKAVAGLVLYPLQWIALAIVAGLRFGWLWALIVLFAVPLLGYIALITVETFEDLAARLRRPDVHVQQQAIRDEILAVARELNATSTSSLSPGAPSGA
jgi:hypothetical protein